MMSQKPAKVLLLAALLCQTSLLIHGATFSTFASMAPNASDTFPQLNIFLYSPNSVYYLYLAITNRTGEGMLCYLAEVTDYTFIQKWGGLQMLGDYSSADLCSLVLDDGGYIYLVSYGHKFSIYNLTAYQKTQLSSVSISLQNSGDVVFLPCDSTTSNPPPPSTTSSHPPNSTTKYPPPPTSPSLSSPPPPSHKSREGDISSSSSCKGILFKWLVLLFSIFLFM